MIYVCILLDRSHCVVADEQLLGDYLRVFVAQENCCCNILLCNVAWAIFFLSISFVLCCHVWENRLSAEGFLFTWASVPLHIYHFAFSCFVSFLFTIFYSKLWTAPSSVSAVHKVLDILTHTYTKELMWIFGFCW